MNAKASLIAALLSGALASASAITAAPSNVVATMFGRLILSVDAIADGNMTFAEASGLDDGSAPNADGESLATAPGVTEGFVSLTTSDDRGAEVDRVGDARQHPMVVTIVPEPEAYVLMLAGLGAVGFLARRRRAQR